jgi:hypothetical protein
MTEISVPENNKFVAKSIERKMQCTYHPRAKRDDRYGVKTACKKVLIVTPATGAIANKLGLRNSNKTLQAHPHRCQLLY